MPNKADAAARRLRAQLTTILGFSSTRSRIRRNSSGPACLREAERDGSVGPPVDLGHPVHRRACS
jgi:hypothetical protein